MPGSPPAGRWDVRGVEPSSGTEATFAPPAGSPPSVVASVSLLHVVADPVRWTVLQELADALACVRNLQEHVPVAANLVSYHLEVLRDAGSVTTSRRGRWIDCALAEDAPARLHAVLPVPETSLAERLSVSTSGKVLALTAAAGAWTLAHWLNGRV